MIEVVPLFLIGLGATMALFVTSMLLAATHRRDVRWLLEHWRDAAKKAGLSSIEEFPSAVTGYSGSLLVRLRELAEERGGLGTEVEIAGPGLAPGLTLEPERSSLLGHAPHPRDAEIGDANFDNAVSALGPPDVALAVLDASTRRSIRTLLRGPLEVPGHEPLTVRGRLKHGVLCVEVLGHPRRRQPVDDASVQVLRDVLAASLALADRLVAPKDLAARLAFTLKHEPVAGIRRRTLSVLLRQFEKHPATREALDAASRDEDPEVRLRAGIALKEHGQGRDVLLELARGETADDATGALAVAALRRTLTLESASELLSRALRARRMQSARACVSVLGSLGAEAVPKLTSVLAIEKGELGEAAARALGETNDPSAEEPLLRALADDTLAPAAAAALGRVGSRSAVAPLREAETRGGALRTAARHAVAVIQSRFTGAAQGQLSLAGDEGGRLTLANDEAGRLSLDETEEPGRDEPASDA